MRDADRIRQKTGSGLPGVRFRDGTFLVARAVELLEEAPHPSEAVARLVLGIRHAPPGLADRLVCELLEADPRVRRDGAGLWRLCRGPGARNHPLSDLVFAVVDVETTGGRPGEGGRIVEIAVVEVCRGRIGEPFVTLVNPGVQLQPWVSRLTGITNQDLAGAPRFEQIGDRVRSAIEGRVFVAHNVGFDWRFLSEELRRAGSPLPTGPRLCTLRLARRALPGLERRGLDGVAGYYGIQVRPRHRAAGDALATAHLLLRLLDEVDRRGVKSWGELRGWLRGVRRSGGAGERSPLDAGLAGETHPPAAGETHPPAAGDHEGEGC